MKHELDRMMSLIKDYKTGYGGVTDLFMQKELEMFAKDYHSEQCNIANVVGRSEQLFCEICELQKVEENGDWCDKCLEDANWSTS